MLQTTLIRPQLVQFNPGSKRQLKESKSDEAPEPDPRTMQPPPRRSAPATTDLERLRTLLW